MVSPSPPPAAAVVSLSLAASSAIVVPDAPPGFLVLFFYFIYFKTSHFTDLWTNFYLFDNDRPVSRMSSPNVFPQQSIAPVPAAAGDNVLESQIPASPLYQIL